MDSDPQLAVGCNFATERVVNLQRLFVVDSKRDRPVNWLAFDRHDGDRFGLGRFAELGHQGADRREPRGNRRCAQPLENLERHFDRIDVGRSLREHHGQLLAASGGVFEITLQLGD